jgi:predicted membrane protein
VGAGVGDRVHRPTSMAELDGRYELGAGNLQLDLRGLELPAGTTEVSASVGAGEVTVWVPADVAVEVEAGTGAGDLDILGRRSNGLGPRVSHSVPGDGGDARLVLDLSAGVGSVEVRR